MPDNPSPPSPPSAPSTAQERHWLYGANVGVLVVVAAAIVIFLCYLTSQVKPLTLRKDLTTGGVNSLSPRTKLLLKDLDAKGQTYELASMFGSHPNAATDEERTQSEEHAQQVRDLLEEYSKYGSDVKIYHPESRDDLETKIKTRYNGEAKPYEAVIGDFDKVLGDLEKFFKAEAPNFGALSLQAGLSDEDKREMASVQGAFATNIPDVLKKTSHDVQHAINATLPEYSTATTKIHTLLDDVISQLSEMQKLATNDQLAKPVQAYFKESAPRYKKMLDELNDYKDRLDKLQPLKIDEVLTSIGADTVVLFGPDLVKVIPAADIYKQTSDAQRGGQGASHETFQGEQAISSALMAVVNPNKAKVVFIGTSAGMTTAGGPYSDIADQLTKDNFEVSEWAPPSPANGQDQPPTAPPAEGKGIVWVVLTPDPPNPQQMQMGMPPPDPRPLVDAVKKHLDEGGSAVFLAEASSPMMGMMGGPGGYPYDSLVRPFGVAVKSQFTVVTRQTGDNGEEVSTPMVRFSRYPEHPITESLQSLPTIFFPGQGAMGFVGAPTIVAVDPATPAGVTADVIVQVDDQDVWASANYTSPQTKFDPAADMKSAITMGVAATKVGADPKNPQRVVVLGSKLFPTNQALEAAQTILYQGRLVDEIMFPGNADLAANSILWASGYQNMIALGPRSGVALRIRDIAPTSLAWLDWGVLYAGAPLLALLAGGIVYFFRRS